MERPLLFTSGMSTVSGASGSQSNAAAIAAQRAAEARRREAEAKKRAADAKAAAEKAHQAQQHAMERRHAVQQTQQQLQKKNLPPKERQGLRDQLDTHRREWREARKTAVEATKTAHDLLHTAEKAEVSGQTAAAKANEAAQRAHEPAPFADTSHYDAIKAQNQRSFDAVFGGKRAKAAEQGIGGLSRIGTQARRQQQVTDAKEALANFRQVKSGVKDPSEWTADEAKRFTEALRQVTDADGVNPRTRERLVAQAAPQLEAAAGTLSTMIRKGGDDLSTDDRRAMYESLSRATELMKPEQQQAFAQKFAAGMGNVDDIGGDDDEFGGIMRDSIESGAGVSLSARVIKQLESDDRGLAADSAAGYVNDAIGSLQSDFHDARDDLAEVNHRALVDVQSFGVHGREGQQALKRFREDSDWAEKQDAFQSSGARLASVLDGLDIMRARVDPDAQATATAGPTEEYQAAHPTGNLTALGLKAEKLPTEEMGDLSQTRAGAARIADAVEAKGRGEPSFIDGVNLAGQSSDTAKKIQGAITASIGARVLDLANEGALQSEARSWLTRGLGQLGEIWGTSDGAMENVADKLGNFEPNRKWAVEYNRAVGGVTQNSVAGQSLKGLGVLFAAASMPGSVDHFGDAALGEKLSTVSQGMGLTSDGAQLALDGFATFAGSKSASAASAVLGKFGGPITAAVGGVGSTLDAIDKFGKGDTTGGVSASLMTAGNLAFTVAPFLGEAAPVALAAGALLSVAGVAVGLFASPEDPWAKDQGQIKDALTGWGVNDDLADKLSDVNADGQSFGPYIQSAAKAAGVSSLDLLHQMNDWPEEQVDQFLDVARLSHDTDDDNENRLNNASAVLGEDNARRMQQEGWGLAKTNEDTTGVQSYDRRVMRLVGRWVKQTNSSLAEPEPRPNVFAQPPGPLFPSAGATAW